MNDDGDPRDTPRHPRRRARLFGHEAAERRLLTAYLSGRMHHAWLITGSRGVGKATLAYRFGRFILKNPDAYRLHSPQSLDVDPEDLVARRVAAGSHADLLTVERVWDEKTRRLKSEITARDARLAPEFFARTAGEGGWRICIVDTADELNEESANALLKILEEPPQRSLFLILANTPGRLLPTIRSRAIRLTLEALDPETTARAVSDVLDQDAPGMDDLRAVARLSGGSPGRALELLNSRGAKLFSEFQSLVQRGLSGDRRKLLDIAEALQARGAEQDYGLFCELMVDWTAGQARERALALGPDAEPWARSHDEIAHSIRVTNALNLDRRQAILDAIAAIEQVAGA